VKEQFLAVLEAAFKDRQNLFQGKIPLPLHAPKEVWINRPEREEKLH